MLVREAAQNKQTNFETFPKLPRPPPPLYFGPPGSTFYINIFYIMLLSPNT